MREIKLSIHNVDILTNAKNLLFLRRVISKTEITSKLIINLTEGNILYITHLSC